MLKRPIPLLLAAVLLGGSAACAQDLRQWNEQSQRLAKTGLYWDTLNREDEKAREKQQKLVATGVVSALDLKAPAKAAEEFNKGGDLLKQQDPAGAVRRLQKAIEIYPEFVSAHDALGMAYMDLKEFDSAQKEFELAAKLDARFPTSFANLGRLALARKDYASAEAWLQKASGLLPPDAQLLTALAWAELANHKYQHALQDGQRVHMLPHTGLANAHFIAAGAALELRQLETAESEYRLVLAEDPGGPLTPPVEINLKAIATYRERKNAPQTVAATEEEIRTFPNSDRLRAALNSLENDESACADCEAGTAASGDGAARPGDVRGSEGSWTLRATVDEVAVMFAVTDGGSLVQDLMQGDIVVRDAHLPPARLVQFAPQSDLPLRLGLLIDTSASVQKRFEFEKRAASRFLKSVLTGGKDLGFAAGFSNKVLVAQDFTHDMGELESGITSLTTHGSTALFDAISYNCFKLANYPDQERVARVLVVLTDGEDNGSRTSLREAIEDAENTGVTVYVISTKTESGDRYGQVHVSTDADRVLEAIAERTGGEAMFPGTFQNLNKTFEKLRKVIRSRYLVAYKPANFLADGKFRPIIIVAKKDGRSLKVHARKGYYAPME